MDFKVSHSDFVFENPGKLRDTYKIGRKLGDGAFSSVRSIRHRITGEQRSVKTIHKKSLRNQQERDMVFTEVGILRLLDHPNIIRLHEFYQDDKNYYIITEYCDGGELFQKIIEDGQFSQARAAEYMRQILSVLTYLHDRNIVHRDLKPENFLLSHQGPDASLKIIDFGSSQSYDHGQVLTKRQGTPYYIAPEVLQRSYNYKCDIWSAGISLFIMLSGYPPFAGNTDDQIIQKVRIGRFSFRSPDWDTISFEAKDLIVKMLVSDPRRRISSKQALQHPWLVHASKLPLNPGAAVSYLNNLKSFRSEQMLQKATLSFIGSKLATSQEREEMIQLFSQLDADNSGTLSRQELKQGYTRLFGDQIEDVDAQVDRIMKEVDIDGSGEIDYSEFVTATLNRQQLLSRQRLETAFRAFDLDGSGSISAEELKTILGKYHRYDDAIWPTLIREVDSNGDGEIDLEEFINMMTTIINQIRSSFGDKIWTIDSHVRSHNKSIRSLLVEKLKPLL